MTRARLARWWEAVGRDLVLLTIRGERPQFAAALAPEGRVLGQLFDAARRTGRPGVPLQVLDEARPALRDGLRLLALRVPASVAAPAPVGGPARSHRPRDPAPGRLVLEGTWTGSQVEQGQRQYLTVVFRRGGGTISYEGGITLTLPLLSLEQGRRDQVRFSVEIRGGIRHYEAKLERRDAGGDGLAGRGRPQRRGDLRAAAASSSAVEAQAAAQLLPLLRREAGVVERRPQALRVRWDRPVPAAGQELRVGLPEEQPRVVAAHAGPRAVAVAGPSGPVEVRAAEHEQPGSGVRGDELEAVDVPLPGEEEAAGGGHPEDGLPAEIAGASQHPPERRQPPPRVHGVSPRERRRARSVARPARKPHSATRFTARLRTPSRTRQR